MTRYVFISLLQHLLPLLLFLFAYSLSCVLLTVLLSRNKTFVPVSTFNIQRVRVSCRVVEGSSSIELSSPPSTTRIK